MLYEYVLLFLSILVAAIMIIIIMLSRTVRFRLRLTLVSTILSLVLWQLTIFVADRTINDLILWNTLVFLWPTMAILSCFAFIRALHQTQTQTSDWSRLTIPILITIAVQFIPIIMMSIFTSVEKTSHGLELVRDTGYYIYLGGLIGSLLLLVAEIIVRRARSVRRSLERYAINVVLTTVIIASSFGVIINAVVPLLIGGQTYIAWGILIIDIFAIGLALSIAKGRLLDVRFYAVRTTVYILSLATLAGVYAILALLLSQWIQGYGVNSLESVVNVALALLLAFLFQPIRHLFDRITNRIFYRDYFDSETFFSQLNRKLTATNDLENLMRSTATYIADALKAEQAFFYIYRGEDVGLHAGTNRHRKLALKEAREFDRVIGEKGMISIVELEETSPIRRLMVSHRIAVILPLRRSGVVIGYFVLGEHRQGVYTRRDTRLLETVADELGIAIQNALSVQEVRDINENLEHRIAVATKELRMSNTQLRKLDEAKDEFISMASHQLRTPLTSIKGYISMIIEGDVGKVTPQQKHLLGEAFMSSERMVRLIGDFLSVSRLQTGKFIIEKHEVNIAKLIQQEVDSLAYTAQSRGLTFEYKQPKNIPLLQLDENKIQQVVMNFMDNAMYYSKSDGGAITIQLKKKAHAIEFTVKDTGIGVPKEEQAKLFSKFFRAENARRQRPDGTGVGLYLAKKVIDAHDGEVIFSSKEGKGSVFGFSIPIKK